jgi:hypothetical protein
MKRPLQLLALALLLPGCAAPLATFESPAAAIQALVDSAEDRARAEELLGPGGFDMLLSGDEVADKDDIDAVRALIKEKVAFEANGDMVKALLGNDEWPLPLPLVKAGNRWRFDVEAGADEILNRRIGRNELDAIDTLRACVEAQREYAALPGHDGIVYAAKWYSTAGQKDGLYWPAAEGEEPSPLGPLLVEAAAEGYRRAEDGEPTPYHGYYYRILTSQGANAPGGARDYADKDGKLRSGFAFLAWPATHGNSGVKTFVVNQQGIVFERDLGPETAELAKKITSYDPDESWEPTVTGG